MNTNKDLKGFMDYASGHKMFTTIKSIYDGYIDGINIADINSFEKERDKIILIIKESGKDGVSQSDLYNYFRKFSKEERFRIMQAVLYTGKVYARDIRIDGSRKTSMVYFYRK